MFLKRHLACYIYVQIENHNPNYYKPLLQCNKSIKFNYTYFRQESMNHRFHLGHQVIDARQQMGVKPHSIYK